MNVCVFNARQWMGTSSSWEKVKQGLQRVTMNALEWMNDVYPLSMNVN
jgi:hypothetical protein